MREWEASRENWGDWVCVECARECGMTDNIHGCRGGWDWGGGGAEVIRRHVNSRQGERGCVCVTACRRGDQPHNSLGPNTSDAVYTYFRVYVCVCPAGAKGLCAITCKSLSIRPARSHLLIRGTIRVVNPLEGEASPLAHTVANLLHMRIFYLGLCIKCARKGTGASTQHTFRVRPTSVY